MIRKLSLLLLSPLILFFSSPQQLYAQETQTLDVTVSPAIIEVTSLPGTTIHQKFRIRNNLSQPLSLTIFVDKLNGSDINGQVIPAPAQAGDQSVSWITFDKQSFTALPQEWTERTITLSIPKDAAFGYYYAIRLSQPSNSLKKTTITNLLGEVAIPLLLTVKRDGAVKKAQLIDFRTTHFINETLPVDFTTIIANTGNVHIKPQGNIFIRGPGEKDLGILNVNSELGSILPGNKRAFNSRWTDGFLVNEPIIQDGEPKVDQNGKLITHLVVNWNKITSFRFGKYTAHLLAVYDNGTRDITIEAITTFWVIPYTMIFGIVIVLIVLIVLIRYLLKQYVKKELKKYKAVIDK